MFRAQTSRSALGARAAPCLRACSRARPCASLRVRTSSSVNPLTSMRYGVRKGSDGTKWLSRPNAAKTAATRAVRDHGQHAASRAIPPLQQRPLRAAMPTSRCYVHVALLCPRRRCATRARTFKKCGEDAVARTGRKAAAGRPLSSQHRHLVNVALISAFLELRPRPRLSIARSFSIDIAFNPQHRPRPQSAASSPSIEVTFNRRRVRASPPLFHLPPTSLSSQSSFDRRCFQGWRR